MLQSIDRSLLVVHYYVSMEKENQLTSSQFGKRLDNVITTHAGKGLYSLCAGNMVLGYKTIFISLKSVLAFQTLTLAINQLINFI